MPSLMFFSHSEKSPYRIVCLCLCNALCKTAASRENENSISLGCRSRQQGLLSCMYVYMDQMLGTVPPSGPLSRMIDNVEANERTERKKKRSPVRQRCKMDFGLFTPFCLTYVFARFFFERRVGFY